MIASSTDAAARAGRAGARGSATPTNYHKYYEGSGIVRCRRGSWSYTILNNSPSFLFFQHGDFTLTVRIGASFCEHRNFVPAALAPKDGGYALHQTMTGWYYLPFAEKPATSDWWQMDNAHREKLYGPDMVFDVQVNEVENGLDIHIVNSGIDRARCGWSWPSTRAAASRTSISCSRAMTAAVSSSRTARWSHPRA